MSLSASVTKCHRLGSIDHSNLFLKVLESQSVMSRGFLGAISQGLSLAHRWLTCKDVLTGQRGHSGVSSVSLKTTNEGSIFMILSKPDYFPKVSPPNSIIPRKNNSVYEGEGDRQAQSQATCSSDTMQRTEMVCYSDARKNLQFLICVFSEQREPTKVSVPLKRVVLGSVRTGVLGSALSTYNMVHNHP